MAYRTDIILEGSDYSTADFPSDNNTPIGYSDRQHVGDAFISLPGWWKQSPTIGIGIQRFLKSSGNALLTLNKIVRVQLNNDGYNIGRQSYDITNGKLTINPKDITPNY